MSSLTQSQSPSRGQSSPSVVELRWDSPNNERVVVVPEDSDKMVIPARQAAEACRAYTDQIRFKVQFDRLNDALRYWATENDSQITEAYLTARDSGLLFLVVSNSASHSDSLEESLTELDLEIANDSAYDLVDLAVHSIPLTNGEVCGDILGSFLSKRFVIRFLRQDAA